MGDISVKELKIERNLKNSEKLQKNKETAEKYLTGDFFGSIVI
ncbi:MAG: hypothetical protein PUG48_08590 [Clostridia bacterium]|nr:hypothetical protein [Clostridia bacterium]